MQSLTTTLSTTLPITGVRALRSAIRSVAVVVLGLILMLGFWVSTPANSAWAAKKALTYTEAQIAQIQKYKPQLEALQDRFTELGKYIEASKWTSARNLIHGPLGSLRETAASLNSYLLPDDRTKAIAQVRQLMARIEQIDGAAKVANAKQVERAYAQAMEEFDAYLALLPGS